MGIGVTGAADQLGVSTRRVRALIAAGALRAERVGGTYVLDEREVDSFADRDRPGHTRAMSPRIAWAAAALIDGDTPTWIRQDELSRLRARLTRAPSTPGAWRAQMRAVAESRRTWRAGSEQVAALMADPATRRTGASATNLVTDLLVGTASASVWVPDRTHLERLRRDLGLIPAESGNVTIAVPAVPDLSSWGTDGENVYRLIVATDLLADTDPRATAAGRALLEAISSELARPVR